MAAVIDSPGYRPRVERALHYIATHLDHELPLAEVAKQAHLSEFHFHRIFTAIVGEPVGRYITRRRLEVAALRLAYEPTRSVTDIALSSGYSSISNFSKAFTGYFLRQDPAWARREMESITSAPSEWCEPCCRR